RLVAISPRIRDGLPGEQRTGRPAQYRVIPLGFELQALAAIDDAARLAARRSLRLPADAPVVGPGGRLAAPRSLGLPADAHVVVTVGRLTAIKQHTLFLEIARLVAARDASAVFLI